MSDWTEADRIELRNIEAREARLGMDRYEKHGEELEAQIEMLTDWAYRHNADEKIVAGLRAIQRTATTVVTGVTFARRWLPRPVEVVEKPKRRARRK